VALAGAAAVTAGGWALQAAALPPPAHADRVAADASAWLHDYRLVVDIFHVHHRRLKGACLRGWFPGPKGGKIRASLLSLSSRPGSVPSGLLPLVGCSGKLSRVLASAAQSGRHLRVERSYAANRPAIALKVDRSHDEHLTLYVSPTTFRPLVAIVEQDGRSATARLYLHPIEPGVLARFHFPREAPRRPH
jgi:hypothetical protein